MMRRSLPLLTCVLPMFYTFLCCRTNITGESNKFTTSVILRSNESFMRPSSRQQPHVDSPYSLLFIFLTIGTGVLLRSIIRGMNLQVPYVVLIFLLGGFFGWLSYKYNYIKKYAEISNIEPKHILMVFLPTLIFKTAFSMDVHMFFKSLRQILIVSVPGFLIAASLIGTAMKHSFHNWSWEAAMLFGIISNTYHPHETVTLLQAAGQTKYVSILLEGEALLNDGTAIVFFNIVLAHITGKVKMALTIFVTLIKGTIGGTGFGFIMGKITLYSLSFFLNDVIAYMAFTMTSTYITYYIAEEIIGVPGVLSIVVLSVVIRSGKANTSSDVDYFLRHFWDLMFFLSNTMIFMMAGVVIMEHIIDIVTPEDIVKVIFTYFTCNVARLIMFLVLSPLLSRVSYGLTWKNCAVAVWSGLRGSVCLCLSLVTVNTKGLEKEGSQLLIHVAGLLILSFIINATTIMTMLKWLGLSDIALNKKVNMRNAVNYLCDMRDRSIAVLKRERLLADSNWLVVEEATAIIDPYKTEIMNENEELTNTQNYMQFHYTICPDCQKENLSEPTRREFKDMLKEVQLRVLNAKKVSYWRQFEHGTLSKKSAHILVGAVEVAATRHEPVIEVGDIKACWKERKYVSFIRKGLIDMLLVTEQAVCQPPKQRWRMKYFKLAVHKWFEIFVYVTIILVAVQVIVEISIHPPPETPLSIILKVFNTIFFISYNLEIIIKILAFGFKAYWASPWNKLDIIILIMVVIDLVMDYLDTFSVFDKGMSLMSTVTTAAKLLRMLHLLRIIRLLEASLPKAIAYLDSYMDVKLSEGYDIGKGFVSGEEEVLKLLIHITDNQAIFKKIQEKMKLDCLNVTRKLGHLQRDRPWIAVTAKSRQAIHGVLYKLRETLSELRSSGLLDDEEYSKLLQVIGDRLMYLKTHYQALLPCSPEILLKGVPWLAGNQAAASFILEHASLVNFNNGDVILNQGNFPTGIYILISGMVKMVYLPTEKTLKDLHQYGALPNIDYISSLQFTEIQEDYIVSGNVIGEMGILTCRPYDSTVTCDTSVQAYEITIDVMMEAMNMSPDRNKGLRPRMWKSIGVRIANIVLTKVPAYQSWSQERIKYHLERAFVPTLSGFSAFMVNELMEDVLLIEGQAMDANSQHVFYAPTYIPRTVQKLFFPKCGVMDIDSPVESKLLIIPSRDANEYEIMETAGQAEMILTRSSKCLHHIIKSRIFEELSLASQKKEKKTKSFGFKDPRVMFDLEPAVSSMSTMKSNFSSSNRVFPNMQSNYYTSVGKTRSVMNSESKETSSRYTILTVIGSEEMLAVHLPETSICQGLDKSTNDSELRTTLERQQEPVPFDKSPDSSITYAIENSKSFRRKEVDKRKKK